MAGLCIDLLAEDPGSAIRARAQSSIDHPDDLHDPAVVSGAYLFTAALFKL